MKATLCAVVCSLLLMTGLVSAQASLQGSWSGEIPGGALQVGMTLSMDGDRVSGSIITAGLEFAIEEGKLSTNVVEFTTTRQEGETATKYLWSGIVTGNEIRFTCIDEAKQGPALEFTVTRQAAS